MEKYNIKEEREGICKSGKVEEGKEFRLTKRGKKMFKGRGRIEG